MTDEATGTPIHDELEAEQAQTADDSAVEAAMFGDEQTEPESEE